VRGAKVARVFIGLDAQMMSSHLLNGADNHKISPRGGGGSGGGVGNREAYQLLNLTESDSDDSALTRLEAGEGARKPENVPDLNLMLPNDQPSRGRRKIRLKRRQHDNRRGFNNALGQDSVDGTEDYDWYVIPSCTARSVLVSSGIASAVVAVVSLIYLNTQINARVSNLAIDLDSVQRQRSVLEDQYSSLSKQMNELLANHTLLQAHHIELEEDLRTVSSQVSTLNETLASVTKSLEEAPHLKTLPSEVKDIRTEVAKFGSRIAELESKVESRSVQSRSAEDAQSDRSDLRGEVQSLSESLAKLKDGCCQQDA